MTSGLSAHLLIVPILLPLVTAAAMLALGEKRRVAKHWLNVASTAAGLAVAIVLAWSVHHGAAPGSAASGISGAFGVYPLSNWGAPFGIVLVLDRLSGVMLVLASLLGLASITFAVARWDRIGIHFHPLFQIQLMGLNGAFLTGDLFNLFVFFEVLLSASYGLLLHASGPRRVSSGLHYIAINLVASSLLLIGAAMLYGVTGTLNMADLAVRVAQVDAADRGLVEAAAVILAVAFLAKAAMWPLGFWLVPAYSAAGAPVAALFAIMTKVGLYAILRLWSLLFATSADEFGFRFGADGLVAGGLATLGFGLLGLLASRQLGLVTAFSLIVSSGTLLAAFGLGRPALTGGALYYLFTSTLAVGAMFLLIELIDRSRLLETEFPNADDADPVPFFVDELEPPPGTNLDEFQEALIGRAIPAAVAFLGLGFIGCTLLMAGMPPLSGFIGKFLMLTALVNPSGLGAVAVGGTAVAAGLRDWTLFALIIVSGLATVIALSRTGIRMFWTPRDRPAPALKIIECLPIAGVLVVCLLLTVRAEPVIRYMQAAADALNQPEAYVEAVFATRPRPGTALLAAPLPAEPASPARAGGG